MRSRAAACRLCSFENRISDATKARSARGADRRSAARISRSAEHPAQTTRACAASSALSRALAARETPAILRRRRERHQSPANETFGIEPSPTDDDRRRPTTDDKKNQKISFRRGVCLCVRACACARARSQQILAMVRISLRRIATSLVVAGAGVVCSAPFVLPMMMPSLSPAFFAAVGLEGQVARARALSRVSCQS